MQWVVTTGPTVADARARALDALGIDESDLEVEVLTEPSTSLFGLRSTEARIRARVRPTRPRPKVDRRTRRTNDKRRRKGRAGRGDNGGGGGPGGGDATEPDPDTDLADDAEAPLPPKRPARTPRAEPARPPAPAPPAAETRSIHDTTPPTGAGGAAMSDIPLDTQEPTALQFVRGLVDAFGVDADVTAHPDAEDDALEIRVEGGDLGLLVGPRGATLAAVAELTRTAVAQQHSGRLEGRLRVDVAGYRARRKEALVRFVGQVAAKVLETGEPAALEPMSPPDRKIVHDAVNDIDGVHTASRGEDRHRHVVIQPDD